MLLNNSIALSSSSQEQEVKFVAWPPRKPVPFEGLPKNVTFVEKCMELSMGCGTS